MRHFSTRFLTVAASVGVTASVAIAAPQQTLVHTNRIFVVDGFNETSGYGDYALSLAFDGTNAYLGGWNNGPVSPGTIGVVKVLDVTGAAPSTMLMPNTLMASPEYRGLDALSYDASTDSIFMYHDSGFFGTSYISRRNATDGSEVWLTAGPASQRVFAGEIDPIGDAGAPAVAFLTQGQGRRLALKVSDGSILYDASGGTNPGGIILGEKNGTDDFSSTWRALTFDSAGNIAVTEADYVGYGTRIGDNQWQSLDAVSDRISKSVEDDGPANLVGQDVAILEGLGVDGSDLLAFSSRSLTQTTDLDGNVTTVANTNVHLRNLDGSTTGLSQIVLTGGDDGVGTDWLNNTKSLAYGLDQSGTPTLLVLDFVERRLDVYQIQAVGLEGDLDFDGFVGITDLNLVLSSWNATVTPGDPADPSGDNFVGIEDLNVVLGNWNAGTPPAAVVPEPATLALLSLSGIAVLSRRR